MKHYFTKTEYNGRKKWMEWKNGINGEQNEEQTMKKSSYQITHRALAVSFLHRLCSHPRRAVVGRHADGLVRLDADVRTELLRGNAIPFRDGVDDVVALHVSWKGSRRNETAVEIVLLKVMVKTYHQYELEASLCFDNCVWALVLVVCQ